MRAHRAEGRWFAVGVPDPIVGGGECHRVSKKGIRITRGISRMLGIVAVGLAVAGMMGVAAPIAVADQSEIADGNVFRISSLAEGNPPIGVFPILPAVQPVRARAPISEWKVVKVGQDRYRLSVGRYPHTGVAENKVIASIHPEQEREWVITHREVQNAFTIALADQPQLGWTLPTDQGESPAIMISPIISTRSMPPQFMPHQLWKFERVE
ncbi:hypothetical protein D5S18_29510 [Nocardia panacis]|uniref:Uncharacterized protein n=1 Tax=Nocardia panacis TaxID=2340916 RepID=A0A3A4K9F1_9NOCA|nr:I66 family serine proteinase inhibitor [Nocardia panacis]RJO70004.1 hypothetical protein D5S18_29510 [Nocardia panacis]